MRKYPTSPRLFVWILKFFIGMQGIEGLPHRVWAVFGSFLICKKEPRASVRYLGSSSYSCAVLGDFRTVFLGTATSAVILPPIPAAFSLEF